MKTFNEKNQNPSLMILKSSKTVLKVLPCQYDNTSRCVEAFSE